MKSLLSLSLMCLFVLSTSSCSTLNVMSSSDSRIGSWTPVDESNVQAPGTKIWDAMKKSPLREIDSIANQHGAPEYIFVKSKEPRRKYSSTGQEMIDLVYTYNLLWPQAEILGEVELTTSGFLGVTGAKSKTLATNFVEIVASGIDLPAEVASIAEQKKAAAAERATAVLAERHKKMLAENPWLTNIAGATFTQYAFNERKASTIKFDIGDIIRITPNEIPVMGYGDKPQPLGDLVSASSRPHQLTFNFKGAMGIDGRIKLDYLYKFVFADDFRSLTVQYSHYREDMGKYLEDTSPTRFVDERKMKEHFDGLKKDNEDRAQTILSAAESKKDETPVLHGFHVGMNSDDAAVLVNKLLGYPSGVISGVGYENVKGAQKMIVRDIFGGASELNGIDILLDEAGQRVRVMQFGGKYVDQLFSSRSLSTEKFVELFNENYGTKLRYEFKDNSQERRNAIMMAGEMGGLVAAMSSPYAEAYVEENVDKGYRLKIAKGDKSIILEQIASVDEVKF